MLEELHRDPTRPSRISAGTLLAVAKPPSDLKIQETATGQHWEAGAWNLDIAKKPWEIALTNKRTGLTWQLSGAERGQVAVLSVDVIRVSLHGNLSLNVAGSGPFFGLGERFDRIKLDGLKTVLRPQDLMGQHNGHNWTYIPVPFLFTPRGLGIYLDTATISSFDISASGFSVQLTGSSVDAYFFIGQPKDILRNYTALTGRSPVPRPWAFGVWICSYQGPNKVLDDARNLRQNRIPSSAIWTYDVMGKGDIMGWPLWWTGYYPHPEQFTAQLHSMGFKVLTYVHPYLRSVLDPYNLPNALFEDGVRNGLLVLDANGRPTGPAFEPFRVGNIDFTKPANLNWWEQKIRHILLDNDFDGWMEDFGEWVNDTDRFAAGVTGRKMANLNPLFYHKITYEITHNAKPDAVEFDRSGYAGSQGYTPVVWGGDQFPTWAQDYGLPSVVRAGITAGLSGFSVWGPDIDGNGYSKELWTRWVEFGALTPIMRNHLWDKPEGAVNLWYDAETLDIFRRYAALHVSLFPYLYTYANQAAKTGVPIIRHPLLEYPEDPNVYNANGEYLLGDKILVAPVLIHGASSRSLYLPKGFWVDYWTGKLIDGGRQVTLAAPLDRIPILVQAGSILPLISPQTQTLAPDRTLTHDLTWRIFPASAPAHDTFTLYDGTVAEASEASSHIEVRVQHSPEVRHYEVILPATRKPRNVVLAGKPLSTGWRLDAHSQTLHIALQARDFDLSVDR